MRAIQPAAACAVALSLFVSGCTGGSDDPDGGDGTAAPAEDVTIPDDLDQLSAEDLVVRLYETSDADLAVALVADGSVPEAIREDVHTSLTGLLDGEVEVVDTVSHDVDGVTIEEVDTNDGIRWCVRPDRRILLQCRVGLAEVEVDTGDVPLDVVEAEVDVFPEEHQLRLQLRPAGDDPVQFPGLLTLFGEDGDPAPLIQTQAVIANQGEIVSQVGRDAAALPGTTLLLGWVTDIGEDLDQRLQLRWDEGAVDLEVGETTWFVR